MIRVELTFRNLLLLFGLLVFAWVTYLVRDTVVLLGMALMLMATLHPLVKLAEHRGLSHSWAVALVMVGLVLVPVLIVAGMVPLIINEVQGFASSFPSVQNHVNSLLHDWGLAERVNQAIAKANLQDRVAGLAVVSVQETITVGAKTLTVIVIAGYLLSDARRLQLALHEFVPRNSERHIEPLLEGMERVVGGYIRGQLLTSALFGVFATLLCFALGIPNALLLGILAAVGDIIPLFGVPAAMIITMLFALTQSFWQPLGVLAGYIVYGQLESHLLVPRVYARTVNMSPLMVIVATVVGGSLYGFVGVLIGIPIAGALKVILDYIVAERLRSRQAAEQEMRDEPSDVVAEQVQEEGESPAQAADVPEPTYSPFESIPEPEPDPPTDRSRRVRLPRIRRSRTEVLNRTAPPKQRHEPREQGENVRNAPRRG